MFKRKIVVCKIAFDLLMEERNNLATENEMLIEQSSMLYEELKSVKHNVSPKKNP